MRGKLQFLHNETMTSFVCRAAIVKQPFGLHGRGPPAFAKLKQGSFSRDCVRTAGQLFRQGHKKVEKLYRRKKNFSPHFL